MSQLDDQCPECGAEGPNDALSSDVEVVGLIPEVATAGSYVQVTSGMQGRNGDNEGTALAVAGTQDATIPTRSDLGFRALLEGCPAIFHKYRRWIERKVPAPMAYAFVSKELESCVQALEEEGENPPDV